MKYTNSTLFTTELQNISDVLELINYRPRTIISYLQCIFECCSWLQDTYNIPIADADILQLRAFLLHLKRRKEEGGLGYAPRSVNLYNCALKKYFRFVLKKPLSNDDLPLCRVDHPLPKVPSQKEVFRLILGMDNLKHMTELAAAYGAGLRISEVTTLRFRDISFSDGTITISEGSSKSRYAGTIELSTRLKGILYRYWKQCYPDARPDDWLFPGQKPGRHISTQSIYNELIRQYASLGWKERGFNCHTLRHSFGLHLYEAGTDLMTIKEAMGHKSISSTTVYLSLGIGNGRSVKSPYDLNR